MAAGTINPKDALGAVRPQLHLVPRAALEHCAAALQDGANKYGAFNYRQNNVKASVYCSAAMRHLTAWFDGEDLASDSQAHHLGHAMACLAILLDAERCGCLADDRPGEG